MNQKTVRNLTLAAALGAVIAAAACSSTGTSSPSSSNGQPVAAVTSAARELDPSSATSTEESDHDRVSYFESVFDQLRQLPVLAPLFQQYQVPAPTQYNDDDHETSGLTTMLSQVRITIAGGGAVTAQLCESTGVPPVQPLGDDVRTVRVCVPFVQVPHAE